MGEYYTKFVYLMTGFDVGDQLREKKTMLLLTHLLSPQFRELHLGLRGLARLQGVRPCEDVAAHRRGDREMRPTRSGRVA